MPRHRQEPDQKTWGRWAFVALGAPGKYLVRCECGTEKEVHAQALKSGLSKSCGCLRDEVGRERMTGHKIGVRHGLCGTKVYHRWKSMMARCYNKRHHKYPLYGGRGISVCAEWHDPAAYYRDTGDPPELGMTLDRIENDGNYEPSNIRWATTKEQLANRRPCARKKTQLPQS